MKNDTSETTSVTADESDVRQEKSASPATRREVSTISPRRKRFSAALLLIAVCFVAGLGGGYLASRSGDSPLTFIDRGSQNDGNRIVTQEEEGIANVATKLGPSVVSIVTEVAGESFFGRPQLQEGAGTGIIVSDKGYVLTNKHVVEGSQRVTVVMADGTTHSEVKVVGTDPLNDVAFLKIDNASNLPVATLGDSSSVRIGQRVVAIGNSLGQYQNTVTSGIISGTGRPVTAQTSAGSQVETLTDLLQTDAAINPGNSGGPLANLSGQVIGINTAVAENAQGIGFSIPINAAKGMLKHLLATGKVERAYIGVNYVTITPEVAETYKLSVKEGAYVYNEQGSAIAPGSPAEKAGLRDKDIITKVNDITVGARGSVSSLVAEYAPGDTVQLTVLRGSETRTVQVTLAPYAG